MQGKFTPNLIILLIVIVLSFLCTEVTAQEITVDIYNKSNVEIIGTKVAFVEDVTGSLRIEDILNPDLQKQFALHTQNIFARPSASSAFWFKFSVTNFCTEDLWFEVGSTFPQYLDFYKIDSLGQPIEIAKMGAFRPDSLKFYQNNLYWFPLSTANDTHTYEYYLRVTSTLPLELPLYVGTIRSLNKNKSIADFLSAAFIGLMVAMFLFNLFLYITTKNHNYFWYLGYLFWMGIGMPYASNFPFIENIEFWFIDKTWWNEYFVLWQSPAYFFMGMFGIRYLDLKNKSTFFYWLIISLILIISVIFPLLILAGFKQVNIVNVFQVFLLLFYISCLASAYYLIIKGYRYARYYALGWSFMILLVIIFFGTVNGFFPYNQISRHMLYFAVAIEALLFSVALGDQINIMRKEEEDAKAKLLNLTESQNKTLQIKVNQRTEELKALVEEIETINDTLTETNKDLKKTNSTKDRLFSIIGHDLIGPIGSIQSVLELSISDDIDKDEFKHYAEIFYAKVKNILFMLTNLLQWANNQKDGIKVNTRTVNISKLVSKSITLLEDNFKKKNITLTNNFTESIYVLCDENQLNIVCVNLLSNALKFTEEKGSVEISFKKLDNNFVEILVADTGIGMERNKVDTLFSAPASTRGTKNEKGNGLGLSLCKDFVERNKGKIKVISEPKNGTSVSFTLPITH